MQIIQLDGVFTYINNVKNLRLDDTVKLIINKNNRINSNAIGVYSNNNKIGYIPYTINQININNTYKIFKINLNKNHLQILIKCNNDDNDSNYINYESDYIKKIKYNDNIIKSEYDTDLLKFSKYLQRSNIIFSQLKITYSDDNYINILIDDNIFYTVTKKYYDNNIFKYDEFFCNNLIPQQIFELFKIHRLDIYLKKNYKSIEMKIKTKNIRQKIIEVLDLKINKIILIETLLDNINIIINSLDIIKILILKELKSDNTKNIKLDYEINTDFLYKTFSNIKQGGLFYSHVLKTYCEIDFYSDDIIIEINNINNNSSNFNKYLLELLIKLVICNKNNINIYNPIENIIIEINISSENKLKLTELLK